MELRGITTKIDRQVDRTIEATFNVSSSRNSLRYVTEEEFAICANLLACYLLQRRIIGDDYHILSRGKNYDYTRSRPVRKDRNFPMRATLSPYDQPLWLTFESPMSGTGYYALAKSEEIQRELEWFREHAQERSLENGFRHLSDAEITKWVNNPNHWMVDGIVDTQRKRAVGAFKIPCDKDTPGYVEERKIIRCPNNLSRILVNTIEELIPFSGYHFITLHKDYEINGVVPVVPANMMIFFSEEIVAIDLRERRTNVQFKSWVETDEGSTMLVSGQSSHTAVPSKVAQRLFG